MGGRSFFHILVKWGGHYKMLWGVKNFKSLQSDPPPLQLSTKEYLGVTVANDLNWTLHIESIVGKANRTLCSLSEI